MDNIVRFGSSPEERPDLLQGRKGGMAVVALISPSAGVGRTTLSAHFAAQAGRSGDGPVAVLDADPKGALWDWWLRRQDKGGAPSLGARADIAGLTDALNGLYEQGARLCVVDTAPGDAAALAPVAALADMLVVPADADAPGTAEAAALGQAFKGASTVAFACRFWYSTSAAEMIFTEASRSFSLSTYAIRTSSRPSPGVM